MTYSRERVSNNRSVMPLDVWGRTRATMSSPQSSQSLLEMVGKPEVTLSQSLDKDLQLFPLKQEFLVILLYQSEMNTSLPFVHTARRYYRLNVLVRSLDWYRRTSFCWSVGCREDDRT